jgi:uncharacterized membrane protein YeiH
MLPPSALFSLIDYLGVFVAAVGGALEAARDERYEFDIIGVVGLALASALGGGVIRDVLLQNGPPLALQNPVYIVIALSGAAVGLLFRRSAGRRTETLLYVVDAAALGLFAVAGSTRGINAGLLFLPSLLLGGVTAVGGGALRDVLSGSTPRIFVRGRFYAIAGALASLVFLGLDAVGLGRTAATVAGTGAGFLVRLGSLVFDWQTRPVRSRKGQGGPS